MRRFFIWCLCLVLIAPALCIAESFGSGLGAFITTNPNYTKEEVTEKARIACKEEYEASVQELLSYLRNEITNCEKRPFCHSLILGPTHDGGCETWTCKKASRNTGWICDGGFYITADVLCDCRGQF